MHVYNTKSNENCLYHGLKRIFYCDRTSKTILNNNVRLDVCVFCETSRSMLHHECICSVDIVGYCDTFATSINLCSYIIIIKGSSRVLHFTQTISEMRWKSWFKSSRLPLENFNSFCFSPEFLIDRFQTYHSNNMEINIQYELDSYLKLKKGNNLVFIMIDECMTGIHNRWAKTSLSIKI